MKAVNNQKVTLVSYPGISDNFRHFFGLHILLASYHTYRSHKCFYIQEEQYSTKYKQYDKLHCKPIPVMYFFSQGKTCIYISPGNPVMKTCCSCVRKVHSKNPVLALYWPCTVLALYGIAVFLEIVRYVCILQFMEIFPMSTYNMKLRVAGNSLQPSNLFLINLWACQAVIRQQLD